MPETLHRIKPLTWHQGPPSRIYTESWWLGFYIDNALEGFRLAHHGDGGLVNYEFFSTMEAAIDRANMILEDNNKVKSFLVPVELKSEGDYREDVIREAMAMINGAIGELQAKTKSAKNDKEIEKWEAAKITLEVIL